MPQDIEDSVLFLAKQQQEDGSFLSFMSDSPTNFHDAVPCQSIFSTAIILSCLNAINDSDEILRDVKRRAVHFLLSQKSENWSFNYLVRESEQSRKTPYPDDLDDTSCALSALCGYDAGLVDGEALANIVGLLTSLEIKEGGPYRTWLGSLEAQVVSLDADLAVNSNIAYFLSLQGVQLESIVDLVESAIESKKYSSPYYPSPYPVIYFISRFYKGEKKDQIIDYLLERRQGDNWGTSLDTALSVLALLNLGVPVCEIKESVGYFERSKGDDGSWEASAFYMGIKSYAGSRALTTAFCLEVMARCSHEKDFENNQQVNVVHDVDEDEIYRDVAEKAKQVFSGLGVDLRNQSVAFLEKILAWDKKREIVLLPYFFSRAMSRSLPSNHRSIVVRLGLANLLGWIAYTIYDDFLDEEGDPRMVSIANVSLREADRIFLSVLPDTRFGVFAKEVFCRIDSANAWEVAHCRVKEKTLASALALPIPDFSDTVHLSDRSLGHALGPIGVMCALGYEIDSKESRAVLEGFRQYLSAKQIYDDMHDWEDDLSRGQVNSASAELFLMIDDVGLVPKDNGDGIKFLRQIFWEKTADVLCDKASVCLEDARTLFLSAGVTRSFVDQLLEPLFSVKEQTIRERNNAKKFISAYAINED